MPRMRKSRVDTLKGSRAKRTETARRKAWREGIREGRAVKFFDGTIVVFPTYEEAERAIIDSEFETPAYRVPIQLADR